MISGKQQMHRVPTQLRTTPTTDSDYRARGPETIEHIGLLQSHTLKQSNILTTESYPETVKHRVTESYPETVEHTATESYPETVEHTTTESYPEAVKYRLYSHTLKP